MTFWYEFFFEKVKNYAQVCSEKGLKRFVHPMNYEERVKFWEKKLLLKIFLEIFFADCLPDKFWQGGQNCIQLVQRKVFPIFYWKIRLLQERVSESQKFPAELAELHSTWPEWHFWRSNFFWREKRFFFCSFPTFCRNWSEFRVFLGRLGKRFRDCSWNCTALVQTKVVVGKTFCRIFHFYKNIRSLSEKSWDLVKKVFSTVVTTAS